MKETNSHSEPLPARHRTHRDVQRVAWVALVANWGLCLAKLLAGLIGHSQAMVADAVHSLSDSVTDIVILIGVKYWSAPPDEEHPYGHWRIETLITTGIGILLVMVAAGITWQSLQNIRSGLPTRPAWIAFWAAIGSLVAKEALFQWTLRAGKRSRSEALIANAWHHRSDALSSIPAAAAILSARLKPEWSFLDPVGAILVSAFVLYAAWKIIRQATGTLVDEGAPASLVEAIRTLSESTQGVSSVHAIRTRKVGPGYHLDLHVQVAPDSTVRQGHDIASDVKYRLLDAWDNIRDVIVHIEPDESDSS